MAVNKTLLFCHRSFVLGVQVLSGIILLQQLQLPRETGSGRITMAISDAHLSRHISTQIARLPTTQKSRPLATRRLVVRLEGRLMSWTRHRCA
jgi:hypothetical protein